MTVRKASKQLVMKRCEYCRFINSCPKCMKLIVCEDWSFSQVAYDNAQKTRKTSDNTSTMTEKTITLPLWIVQKAISALGLTVSSIQDECCLKRQCASAANYLRLCLEKPDATDDDFANIAKHYLCGKIKGVVVQIGKNDALIIEDESQDWRHSQRHVTLMNKLGKNWYYVDALRDLKRQANEEDVKLVEQYMQ